MMDSLHEKMIRAVIADEQKTTNEYQRLARGGGRRRRQKNAE